jgi:hypothetical protein
MGKRAKEHKKRVAARNQRIKAQQKQISNLWNQEIQKEIERLREDKRIGDISQLNNSEEGNVQINL